MSKGTTQGVPKKIMKQVTIILCILALTLSSCKQTTKKQVEETETQSLVDSIIVTNQEDSATSTTQVVELPPPPPPPIAPEISLELPSHVKSQRQPRTTPARNVIIEVANSIPTNTEIYYYSPRMENKGYSYRKELGDDNNFLGMTDFNNKAIVSIPDTCEQGAQLMFHTVGYELLKLPIESILNKSQITVQLTPKIYHSTIVLEERIFRDTISIIEVSNLHEPPTNVFYGQCLPIYDDDGINHGDPYCAFACMGCSPEFNFSKSIHLDELD